MEKHMIKIDEKTIQAILNIKVIIDKGIEAGEYVPYPKFVDNLFKYMETPAASFHHATTGISGEAGELLDASKKVWVYGQDFAIDNVLEELGDIRYYYQQCLNMLGLLDEDIQAINIRKLTKRYPEGMYTDEYAALRLDKKENQEKP